MTIDTSQCSWFVYVLRNPDGKLYIGQTDNIPHRLHQHNDRPTRSPEQRSAFADRGSSSTPKPQHPAPLLSSGKSAKIRPRQSLAQEANRLLIRLRRIVGSNPTAGAKTIRRFVSFL